MHCMGAVLLLQLESMVWVKVHTRVTSNSIMFWIPQENIILTITMFTFESYLFNLSTDCQFFLLCRLLHSRPVLILCYFFLYRRVATAHRRYFVVHFARWRHYRRIVGLHVHSLHLPQQLNTELQNGMERFEYRKLLRINQCCHLSMDSR